MRIECQTCNTHFKLDDSLIKKDGTKVRCSKCKEIITVYPQEDKPSAKPFAKSGQAEQINVEAEKFEKNSIADIDTQVKSKKANTRIMVLIGLFLLSITGPISFYFQYLDKYAVLLISVAFLGILWPQLSNIAAGIWLKIDPQFQEGDHIGIENNTQGYVKQINFRTTRLQTDTMAIISIPNHVLIQHKIVNYSTHPESCPLTCEVQVDINNSPDRVRKILLDAALPVKGLAKDPAPFTSLCGLSGNGLSTYALCLYIEDQGLKLNALEDIWNKIWHLFKRAGILPFVEVTGEEDEITASILEEVDIFRPFTDYAKSYMSKNMNRRNFRPNEHVFYQGDEGESLFIIEEGVVSVQVEITPGKRIEVARLGAGSFFGEMALLTGETRTANIVAISDTILFEITREHIAPLIEEQPQISQSLSELLVQRKIETESEKNKYRAEKINRKALKKQIMEQIDVYFKSYQMAA
ncbi:MAG: zinc-ribbon domain-containing protein [Candidatus Magnetomorum sp.]|nr:zinc-ribbon domain-containing protein [Candidatus Magnetomorum sp.]